MYPSGGDRKVANRQMVEAATQRKATNDTQYFWDLVQRHMNGHYVGPRKMPRHAEENFLFAKKAEQVSTGCIDDNIPVERSGPKSFEIAAIESFSELHDAVPPSVLKCFESLRFENPSPIQKHSIPLGLAGLDLVCCAQTGSGKTFAFLVPLVTALDHKFQRSKSGVTSTDPIVTIDQRGSLPRAIVLAPTRELASQIQLDARRLTFGSHLKSVCVYGGNDIRAQLQELAGGCDLIVATPGRLNDLVDRGCVSLSQVQFLVLDEADRMLDMGFEPQIRKIVEEYDMPRGDNRQTFMFSATFPSEIQKLARDFLRNYVWIAVGRVGSTVENIRQQVLMASADPNKKLELLMTALGHSDGRTLVFVQKKKTATWLVECLRSHYNVTAEEIHGDRSQSQREYALRMFRDGNIRILVATDVAARGLDVPQVMHVVQFDMPLSAEDFDVYVHRIGRTGRAGMTGLATCLFVPGKETGEGNGRIAPQLLTLLQENNQEVPEWFLALDDLHHNHHNQCGSRRFGQSHHNNYNNHNNWNQKGGGRFGFSDARSNQHNTLYTANHHNHNNGGNNKSNNYHNQPDHNQTHSRGYGHSNLNNHHSNYGSNMYNNNYNHNQQRGHHQHQQNYHHQQQQFAYPAQPTSPTGELAGNGEVPDATSAATSTVANNNSAGVSSTYLVIPPNGSGDVQSTASSTTATPATVATPAPPAKASNNVPVLYDSYSVVPGTTEAPSVHGSSPSAASHNSYNNQSNKPYYQQHQQDRRYGTNNNQNFNNGNYNNHGNNHYNHNNQQASNPQRYNHNAQQSYQNQNSRYNNNYDNNKFGSNNYQAGPHNQQQQPYPQQQSRGNFQPGQPVFQPQQQSAYSPSHYQQQQQQHQQTQQQQPQQQQQYPQQYHLHQQPEHQQSHPRYTNATAQHQQHQFYRGPAHHPQGGYVAYNGYDAAAAAAASQPYGYVPQQHSFGHQMLQMHHLPPPPAQLQQFGSEDGLAHNGTPVVAEEAI